MSIVGQFDHYLVHYSWADGETGHIYPLKGYLLVCFIYRGGIRRSMQTRIVAIMMICLVALSGATAVSGGVSYTSLDSMNENNITEVSVNPVPTVSNSKQRRQYRLAYVSWKNRIADLRMSAIFKWLRTEYYPSLVSIADAASSGSSSVSFARDSMTIQDAWWDLDETMDMELHRDSADSHTIDEDGNVHPNWQVWMREYTYCPDCQTSWLAISSGGDCYCTCDARDSADSDSHTIDLTPSPKGYARMLEVVIKDSTNADDVEWATAELNKIK